ncbi:PepSY domain-containing protein [Alcanivorax sp. IO_7]|nr:PepSY domain-containing protein [Alcanivorax sp. IO_7]
MTVRQRFVVLHRYVGLVMAGFLIIAGLTGALLVWYYELDALINPQWLQVEPRRRTANRSRPSACATRWTPPTPTPTCTG